MKQAILKTYIRELALKYNLTIQEVEDIVNLPFELLHEVIESADRETCDFKTVKIPRFLKFYVSDNKKGFYLKFNRRNKKDGKTD
jgi:hypothetical protein